MATNNNGHLVDDKGNVVVDFVWGNLPMQPNDDRTNLLNFALDSHAIAEAGWNGYPGYVPNTLGEYVGGVPFIVVPNVVGQTTALAIDALKDAGYVNGNITTAAGATNAATTITAISRSANSFSAVITAAAHGLTVGSKVTISALANGNVEFNGTWTVTAATTDTFTITSLAKTAVTQTGLTGSVVAVSGTIKAQSVAPGADSIALGTTITITPWA